MIVIVELGSYPLAGSNAKTAGSYLHAIGSRVFETLRSRRDVALTEYSAYMYSRERRV